MHMYKHACMHVPPSTPLHPTLTPVRCRTPPDANRASSICFRVINGNASPCACIFAETEVACCCCCCCRCWRESWTFNRATGGGGGIAVSSSASASASAAAAASSCSLSAWPGTASLPLPLPLRAVLALPCVWSSTDSESCRNEDIKSSSHAPLEDASACPCRP